MGWTTIPTPNPIHKTNTFCNYNYTDGEHAAAIPTVKGTESDVMVFATEDEQEALTETDVVSLVRHNDGGLKQARGGVLYLFMVS